MFQYHVLRKCEDKVLSYLDMTKPHANSSSLMEKSDHRLEFVYLEVINKNSKVR